MVNWGRGATRAINVQNGIACSEDLPKLIIYLSALSLS